MSTRRDHSKLLCDVGELSGLFADSSSLDQFLNEIVQMVARHMRSPVCSIYLFDESKAELVLRATQGLNPESIGKVRMKLGEGLTGLAVQELRSINERQSSQNPHFKSFPGIGEEKFESFLVVPIVRGQTRIGAIVLQNSQKNYFSDADERAFRAVTSQLANTIETAKLLMSLTKSGQEVKAQQPTSALKFLKGRAASEGFAYAPVVVISPEAIRVRENEKCLLKYSLDDFWQALQASESELKGLQKKIEEQLSDVASLIFAAQLLMLKDQEFIDQIVGQIKQGTNPPQAIISTVDDFVRRLESLSDAYLREKSQDVQDVGRRLLENLTGHGRQTEEYEGKIVVARELLPSDALKLSSQKVRGIILLTGGVASHLSILAKSLLIPLIIVDAPQLLNLDATCQLLMDAALGNIYINPDQSILAQFKEREDLQSQLERLKKSIHATSRTQDGQRITMLANINLLGDLKFAREFKAEGIGLYRTEFPFMVRSTFPTEEEQFVIYRKLVEGAPGKEVTFRTLDIGGDKVLSYFHDVKEENPFLGMRSIRFSLKYKEIFEQQVRAILRAGQGANLKIMFPMISSLDEFLEAKQVVEHCLAQLKSQKLSHHTHPIIGMMVELPAVLEIIDELAQAADFFCIGTNDFIQYMLAVDRTNEKVADLYLPHHPSVLRGLKKIVVAAKKHHKEVTICGDMADDERYTEYLLGIGLTRFSINSRYIARIQTLIKSIDLGMAKKKVVKLLKQHRVGDIVQTLGIKAG